MEKAQQFLEKYTGTVCSVFYALPESGSPRRNYVAISGERSFIVTSNRNIRENESFFYLTQAFQELQLNTPKIFRISADRTLYIQEYLGSRTLSEIIADEGITERVALLVKKTLVNLYQLQQQTAGKIDFSNAFEYDSYNELPVQNDLFYFKSFIADVLELPYHKARLLQEFRTLTTRLSHLGPRCVMLRDFQSRNIMVNEEDEVFFIDYQSAMEGPAMYDVISFLFQARANFPADFRTEMLDYFVDMHTDPSVRLELKQSVGPLQLIRFMQVLGAYGFRGLIQRKQHFISSLDAGIENLYELATNWPEMDQYPELKKLTEILHSSETKKKINQILSKE